MTLVRRNKEKADNDKGSDSIKSISKKPIYPFVVSVKVISTANYAFREDYHTFDQGDKLAEDLCHEITGTLGIGTICCHAFALRLTDRSMWLAPNQSLAELTGILNDHRINLELRFRFRPSSFDNIATLDPTAFEYMFAQIRHDFFKEAFPKIHRSDPQEQPIEIVLGLACTDLARYALENNMNPDSNFVEREIKNFLPTHLSWQVRFISKFKMKMYETVVKAYQNCKRDVVLLKSCFMRSFVTDLHPLYGHESYIAVFNDLRSTDSTQVRARIIYNNDKCSLEVSPIKDKKSNSMHMPRYFFICDIHDVCYATMQSAPNSKEITCVEISRNNGTPLKFIMNNELSLKSFVSLMDGYYRLMSKWSFNICHEIINPTLMRLRDLKSHGPIGREYAVEKLISANRLKAYIIRQSSKSWHKFKLDVTIQLAPMEVKTCTIVCEDGKYYLFDKDDEPIRQRAQYKTMSDLIKDTAIAGTIQPMHCIHPNEYDECSKLQLSVRPKNLNRDIDESGCPKVIPASHIELNGKVLKNTDQYSVRVGHMNGIKIVVKQFPYGQFGSLTMTGLLSSSKTTMDTDRESNDLSNKDMIVNRDLMGLLSSWIHTRSAYLVRSIGMCIGTPTWFVQEYIDGGPLDQYLMNRQPSLDKLTECVTSLARALLYLQEHHIIHGIIRCHNILVVAERDNSLHVKLADPIGKCDMYEDSAFFPQNVREKGPSYFTSDIYHSDVDVWAFGTTVWQIFSNGKRPKPGSTETTLLQPSSCPYDLWLIVQSCWHANPEQIRQIQPLSIVRDTYHVFANLPNDNSDTATVETESTYCDRDSFVSHNRGKTLESYTSERTIISNAPSFDTILSEADSSSIELIRSSSARYIVSRFSPAQERPHSSDSRDESSQGSIRSRPGRIEFSQLKIVRDLGEGVYGRVRLAELTELTKKHYVAIKSINCKNASESNLEDLKQEYNMMASLDHPNIVKVLGFVERPQLMLVMEYLECGSLSSYLKRERDSPLPFTVMHRFAIEIARGMDHLASRCSIVHRDLAARNVLVGSNQHVKICDFGLARFIDPYHHHYQLKTLRHLPLKWYAPETLDRWVFTNQTDVWSYGVVLWEMLSGGEDPKYPCGPCDLLQLLRDGFRLKFPDRSAKIFADVSGRCWEFDPQNRPSFLQIVDMVELMST